LSRGVDWIKTLATERAGTPDTDPRKQVYTEAELRVIVEEAAAKNIPVMAHAHGAEGALAAVKAGVRSLEHGTYLTVEALQLMATQGTFFVPTANFVDALDREESAILIRRAEVMRPYSKSAIQRAQRLGVKIAAGSDTDYGSTGVAWIGKELLMLVETGLTPLQALQAATVTNAELMRLEKQTGAVEAGLEADLLIVDANPLDNIRALFDPLLVISNGRIGLDRMTFGKP
jgi:imidazolonepropionase-like amidohydrolase